MSMRTYLRFAACSLLLSTLASALVLPVLAADEPATPAEKPAAPYPVPNPAVKGWALEFTQQTPRLMGITGTNGKVTYYWYMPFHVLNRSEGNVAFVPHIEVLTSTGKFYHCNKGISTEVFNAVFSKCGNSFIRPMEEISGDMPVGRDHARDGVAIWPMEEGDDVDAFTVFVAGIYEDTEQLKDPVTGELMTKPAMDPQGKPKVGADGKPVTEPFEARRTLMLEYASPGTSTSRPAVKLEKKSDVMR